MIVGTHSLIQDAVTYHRLGLVITDEQHRFGVNQRRIFREKGDNPDVLMMTATPILGPWRSLPLERWMCQSLTRCQLGVSPLLPVGLNMSN